MRKGRQVPVMTEYGADSQTVSSQNEDVRQYWDQDAYDFADQSPDPEPEMLWKDVYAPVGEGR